MPAIPSNSVNVGALIASLGLDTTAFQAGIAGAEAKMASVSAKMAAMGAKMVKVGKMMTTGLTLPILAAGVASIKAQKDFEASMSKIIGLVGVSVKQTKEWEQAILALGPAVGKGPEELADAMFFIASAGIRGARALEVLEMSAKASASGLGETKLVADLVTSAMNAYGAANLDAAMATDILVATVREGKAEATDLAGAMGMVLPIASEMGVTFDQVGAAFAGMTRTGTNARVAATQLKAILSKLMNPTQMAEEALTGMGTSSAELRKSIKEDGLISTLETLRKTTNKYGEEAMSKVFPNIRALMGVLDLMGKNMEENIAISERMADSTGSLDAAFAAATQTTQFKWDKALSQIKTTFTRFGMLLKGTIVPIIEKFTNKIEEITTKFMRMTDAQKKNTVKILAMTAAIGPLMLVMGKLFIMLSKNPYMALAAAIGFVVLGIIKMINRNREVLGQQEIMERIQKKVNERYSDQRGELEKLIWIAKNENIEEKERLKAIKKLNEIMPNYNGYLEKETGHLKANTVALDEYLVKLKEEVKLLVFKEQLIELTRQQVVATDALTAAQDKYNTAQKAFEGAGGTDKKEVTTIHADGRAPTTTYAPGPLEKAAFAAELAWNNAKTALAGVEGALVELDAKAKGIDFTFGGGNGNGNGNGDGDGGGESVLEEDAAGTRLALIRATAQAEISIVQDKFTRLAMLEDEAFNNKIDDLNAQKVLYPSLKKEIDALIEAEYWAHEGRLVAIGEESAAAQIASKKKITEAHSDAADKLDDINQRIVDSFNRAFSDQIMQVIDDFARALGEAVVTLDFSNIWKSFLISMGNFAQKFGALILAQGVAVEAFKKSLESLNGVAAVIAGVGLIAAGIAVKAFASKGVKEFAMGGIAYGPTMGMVGEYPGARSNPEVIAPLSQLKGMLGGGGGGNFEIIETDIRGADIHLVLQRYNNTLTRSGK